MTNFIFFKSGASFKSARFTAINDILNIIMIEVARLAEDSLMKNSELQIKL